MSRSPGLFDIQVNGYAGVDFNDAGITADALDHALAAMRRSGVSQCLPTLITASETELAERFGALDAAVSGSRLGPSMVPGYHLEGPFLDAAPGFAGCHPTKHMIDPDGALVERLERSLKRPILLLTLAPERPGSIELISTLRRRGVAIAMAHSNAGFAEVEAAADAGLTLSTHLGNGLPHLLHKLDNPLLAQLAEPRLSACLIADGHHVPAAAMKALVSLKGAENCILVTDAVLGAAAPAGNYVFAGMTIEKTESGAMRQPGQPHLAGSALLLDDAVRNIVSWGVADIRTAIAMASDHPRRALARAFSAHDIAVDPGVVIWDEDLRPQLQG